MGQPKKGSKTRKQKQVRQAPQRQFDHISLPDVVLVDVEFNLSSFISPILLFRAKLAPETSFGEVAAMIASHHGGTVGEICVYLSRSHEAEKLDLALTLMDKGIKCGECRIFYDFVPLESPVLL